MRVQCGQGHWFNDQLGECDHDDGGVPCGWRPGGAVDNQAKIRAILAGQDPVLATAPLDDVEDPDPAQGLEGPEAARAALDAATSTGDGPAEARASLQRAKERKSDG